METILTEIDNALDTMLLTITLVPIVIIVLMLVVMGVLKLIIMAMESEQEQETEDRWKKFDKLTDEQIEVLKKRLLNYHMSGFEERFSNDCKEKNIVFNSIEERNLAFETAKKVETESLWRGISSRGKEHLWWGLNLFGLSTEVKSTVEALEEYKEKVEGTHSRLLA